jgi:hypothetical protein
MTKMLRISWSLESDNAIHPGRIGLGKVKRNVRFASAELLGLDTSTARTESTFPSSNTLQRKLLGDL